MPCRFLRLLLLALACAGAVPPVSATSVVAPSFPELVAEAEAIYSGRVTAVEDDKLDIEFEKSGSKRVLDRFVEKA